VFDQYYLLPGLNVNPSSLAELPGKQLAFAGVVWQLSPPEDYGCLLGITDSFGMLNWWNPALLDCHDCAAGTVTVQPGDVLEVAGIAKKAQGPFVKGLFVATLKPPPCP
jgi:hypothetical protein